MTVYRVLHVSCRLGSVAIAWWRPQFTPDLWISVGAAAGEFGLGVFVSFVLLHFWGHMVVGCFCVLSRSIVFVLSLKLNA